MAEESLRLLGRMTTTTTKAIPPPLFVPPSPPSSDSPTAAAASKSSLPIPPSPVTYGSRFRQKVALLSFLLGFVARSMVLSWSSGFGLTTLSPSVRGIGGLNATKTLDNERRVRKEASNRGDGGKSVGGPSSRYLNGSLPPLDWWLLDDDDNDDGDDNNGDGASSIPKIINKVFLQSRGGFLANDTWPQSLRDAHDSWKVRNPGYRMRYFDLHRCRSYLADHFHPVFLRAFDCLQAFAAKTDFFRYAVVYRDGGWYSDWKEVCLEDGLLGNLSGSGNASTSASASESNASWFSAWDHGHQGLIRAGCMQNAFFGASPRHAILAEALRIVLANVKDRYYGENPLFPTSPCAFGKAFRALNINQNTHPATDRNTNGGEEGGFRFGYYSVPDFVYRGRPIVRHKCEGCGSTQDWGGWGNNYNNLWNSRRFYCEDSPSLLNNGHAYDDMAHDLEEGSMGSG